MTTMNAITGPNTKAMALVLQDVAGCSASPAPLRSLLGGTLIRTAVVQTEILTQNRMSVISNAPSKGLTQAERQSWPPTSLRWARTPQAARRAAV